MTLKMVALARIVTRDALLPATTAIGSIEELGGRWHWRRARTS